jgi:hypothetical protein
MKKAADDILFYILEQLEIKYEESKYYQLSTKVSLEGSEVNTCVLISSHPFAVSDRKAVWKKVSPSMLKLIEAYIYIVYGR